MPANNSGINISTQMDFIRKKGERVDWWIGMKCTCTSSILPTGTNFPDANRPNPNCKACDGVGRVWTDKKQILGLVENINQHKDLLNAGIVTAGDFVFSPDLRYTLSDYDRIQLKWTQGIPYEGELRTRGTGQTDKSMYGIMSVTKLSTFDPVSGVETEYKLSTDFTIDAITGNPTNVITWLQGKGPPANAVYSIKYQALMDWIAFIPPQPRRERGTNLGQRVILRKKHLVVFGN